MKPLHWFFIRLLVLVLVIWVSGRVAWTDPSPRDFQLAALAPPLMGIVWWIFYGIQKRNFEMRAIVEDWSASLWSGTLLCMPHWFFFMGLLFIGSGAAWLRVALERGASVSMPLTSIPIGLGMVVSVLHFRRSSAGGPPARGSSE
ncbi:MAG: hypothetical protein JWM32_2606 [Verrucomicrobia bacterium]|nr:hypothetical protein [Verrucomicrobiota bacterium]